MVHCTYERPLAYPSLTVTLPTCMTTSVCDLLFDRGSAWNSAQEEWEREKERHAREEKSTMKPFCKGESLTLPPINSTK
jgi:hypothetical protein